MGHISYGKDKKTLTLFKKIKKETSESTQQKPWAPSFRQSIQELLLDKSVVYEVVNDILFMELDSILLTWHPITTMGRQLGHFHADSICCSTVCLLYRILRNGAGHLCVPILGIHQAAVVNRCACIRLHPCAIFHGPKGSPAEGKPNVTAGSVLALVWEHNWL